MYVEDHLALLLGILIGGSTNIYDNILNWGDGSPDKHILEHYKFIIPIQIQVLYDSLIVIDTNQCTDTNTFNGSQIPLQVTVSDRV